MTVYVAEYCFDVNFVNYKKLKFPFSLRFSLVKFYLFSSQTNKMSDFGSRREKRQTFCEAVPTFCSVHAEGSFTNELRCEADKSQPSRAEVKNEWNYTQILHTPS
jgi:hypothetical protein